MFPDVFGVRPSALLPSLGLLNVPVPAIASIHSPACDSGTIVALTSKFVVTYMGAEYALPVLLRMIPTGSE
ncbi:hypothetical protein BOTU111921_27055 [Bordetella tumbae]